MMAPDTTSTVPANTTTTTTPATTQVSTPAVSAGTPVDECPLCEKKGEYSSTVDGEKAYWCENCQILWFGDEAESVKYYSYMSDYRDDNHIDSSEVHSAYWTPA